MSRFVVRSGLAPTVRLNSCQAKTGQLLPFAIAVAQSFERLLCLSQQTFNKASAPG